MVHEDDDTRVQLVRGLPCPRYAEFKKENIEDAMDYKPKDGDVIIASYPKSGTTWLQYIVLQIISKAELFPAFDDLTWKVAPFIELVGAAVVDAVSEPRIYKHHLPYNMVQKNDKSKCLYIYRNPEDVVVSYHRFIQSYDEDVPVDFDKFFENFVSGNTAFGSCFDHVMSFYASRKDSNLLMVSYEQLHLNTKDEILRIAKFLGDEHYECLAENGTLLSKIVENTSFENMKNNLFLTHPDYRNEDGAEKGVKKVTFFRKGIVGDGKRVLTGTQGIRIREAVEKTMKGTSIAKEWLKK